MTWESVIVGIIGCTLVAWFVCTILAHLPGMNSIVRRLDPLGLIPTWNFFAPTPGTHDFRLLVRDQLSSGSMTSWTLAERGIPRRRWYSPLWHPYQRETKALFDVAVDISHQSRDGDLAPELLQITIPYLLLLTAAHGLPRSPWSRGRQFAVGYASRMEESSAVLIRSALHPFQV